MNTFSRLILAFLIVSAVPLAAEEMPASEVQPDPIPGAFEECIAEPIFEGQVCTAQFNRNASVGVILIHGLGGSISDWTNTIPALANNFHVVAFDLPGFGRSDKGSKHYSPTMYARVAQFLAERYFKDKDFHIVGHSMGAATALRFASLRPERFRRLVLIDVAGILHPQVISRFEAGSMMEKTSGFSQTRGIAERISGKVLEQMHKLPILPTDLPDSATGRDTVLQGSPEKIAALELAGEDFSAAIPRVTEPTLILWGDSDLNVPLRTGEVLAARMPQARLQVISNAAHVPMQDRPEELNKLVLGHLLASDRKLAAQYKRPARKSGKSLIGVCNRESDKVFEGDYERIELRDCSNITIRNARIGNLHVYNSRASISDTNITGKEEGLYAEYGDLTLTNVDISGDTAVLAKYSRLDMAGVHLNAKAAGVKALGSKLLFSICVIHSQHTDGAVHDYRNLDDGVL